MSFTLTRRPLWALLLTCAALSLTACGDKAAKPDEHGETEADFERGPHNGRLLRDGDFSLEVTIFETGVEPEFRLYGYRKDKPLDPRQVNVEVALTRLGGKVDRFSFNPQEDYLRGAGLVREPHSFDVAVTAREGGKAHAWRYASYEGRTTLSKVAAEAGGVKVEVAGPATMGEAVTLSGRIEVTPEGKGEVRAWYPGRIMSLRGELGQMVRKGQILARVESSESLQTYSIPAPISGQIIEKNSNVGDVAYDRPIFVIADPTKLHAELFVYPRDSERVRVGQKVEVRSLSGADRILATVESILPSVDVTSQTQLAHVHLPDGAGPAWRPGLGVEGGVTVASRPVALAVRTGAIQRFRDFDVVFARIGDTYEVRMLELGVRTPEWTEVLGGLEPGTTYVTDGAFLIRADIEKSGASHDH
ncbi:efflux RND transporter periplasmic adaptor subunit [Caulobacter sp. DWR1-3-2b1]|uniref:efflux RND transporter periplasmic adaptor subunit n=1 Tax=Caulobacter sp. DWR1-3-2b1 TaxID=2804670 RepID=UPI003CF64720